MVKITRGAGAVWGLAVVGLLGGAAGADEVVTLTSLSEYQVVQRNASNYGSLKIQGAVSGSATQVEARVVDFLTSTPVTGWTVVDTTVGGGAFSGSLNVGAGWYTVEVRGTDGVSTFASSAVDRVGVGDVFITAGQSNSANHGSPAQPADSPMVSTRTSLSLNTWRHADDPQPLATGGGGSPWPQLGDLMTAANGVPVGFVNVGVGGTRVDQWLPGTTNYDTLLKPAIQSQMAEGGFRAILWHQGESDAEVNTGATNYANRLQQVIAASRLDAGWNVAWGIAEASYVPGVQTQLQEPIAAGQRKVAFSDANVFLGPRTDDFYLEGKLTDLVHFNAAGLNDHAQQWADALNGVRNLTPKNAGFEAQVLADGASVLDRVIGWNKLGATGEFMALGANGVYNPNTGAYSNPAAAGFEGENVATLAFGSAGNFMLQTLDAFLEPSTLYTLTIAIGVRNVSIATLSNFQIDLLADGVPLGTGYAGSLATLNALAGGSAAGKFTDVTYQFTTGDTVGKWQSLGVRVTKVTTGGASYVDFDNVRVTAVSLIPVPSPAALPAGLVLIASWCAPRRRPRS